MKILHIISTTGTGGAEQNLLRLVTGMDKKSFRNTVVSMTGIGPIGENIRDSGIDIYALNMLQGTPDPRGIIRLVHIIHNVKPNIIQCWMYHANIIGILFKHKRLLIWNIRCSDMDITKYGLVYKYAIKAGAKLSMIPDAVIVNSFSGKSYHEGIGYHPRKWNVIQNGFNINIFKPDPIERALIRSEMGIPQNALIIGLIARFDLMKDHMNFFEASRSLLEKHPDTHFILAGTGVERDNPEIIKLMRGIKKKEAFHLLGEKNNIPAILSSIDISSSSSYGEGFPNVIGESMACGVPCVVTDVGDSKYLVGDTGIVVPKQNPEALFMGIKSLIDAGHEYRAKLGEAARKRIIEQFSLEKCVKQYESLYLEYAK